MTLRDVQEYPFATIDQQGRCRVMTQATEPVGSFMFGCGCGNEVRIHNQRVIHSATPCASCLSHLRADIEASVNAELEWCGCGNAEDVDALMLRYLSVVPRWEHEGDTGLSDGEYLLLAYIADKQGWTEHGSSIGGAWLTDEGKEVLAALRERAAASDVSSAVPDA